MAIRSFVIGYSISKTNPAQISLQNPTMFFLLEHCIKTPIMAPFKRADYTFR